MTVQAFLRFEISPPATRDAVKALHFVCTTQAELPTGAATINGDTAYTADTRKRWDRSNGAWVQSYIDVVDAPAADPAYAPGSFTVATGTGRLIINRLQLTTTQRATLQGTSRLKIS